MKKLNILITCGPTREPIDPVRFVSNYSTGFFGCELARQAKKRGHRVVLISGPLSVAKPLGVPIIDVVTAGQMQQAVEQKFSWCDCLIMNAAVGDFQAQKVAGQKIKREQQKELTLRLKPNPDILVGLSGKKGKRLLVGFALETERLKQNAQAKLRRKKLDMIVATPMKARSYPFGRVKLESLIIDQHGTSQQLKGISKERLSGILLDSIERAALN